MSDFPTIEAPYPVRIGDLWDGRWLHETITDESVAVGAGTPVDVTTSDWIITFKDGDEVVFVMSTDNGYLTTSGTQYVDYSLPAVDTATLPATAVIYGELKNLTTNKTLMGIRTAIVPSTNE